MNANEEWRVAVNHTSGSVEHFPAQLFIQDLAAPGVLASRAVRDGSLLIKLEVSTPEERKCCES